MALPEIVRRIRHAPILRESDALWRAVRPTYDASLRLAYQQRGLPITVGEGLRIRVDPACRGYVWDNSEIGEEALWHALMVALHDGDRFADVGAHIGVYTTAAALRGARVVSYEPNPTVASLLRRNVALNGVGDRVEVREVAVGAKPGEARLAVGGTLALASRLGGEGILVKVLVLTEPVDVMKIDVEGHEIDALEGAHDLLTDKVRRPRAIFVELHPTETEALPIRADRLKQALLGYETERLAAIGDREHWVGYAT